MRYGTLPGGQTSFCRHVVFTKLSLINILYVYSPAGRSMLKNLCPRNLSPTQDREHSFPNTDRPRPVKNIIFFPQENKAQVLQPLQTGVVKYQETGIHSNCARN